MIHDDMIRIGTLIKGAQAPSLITQLAPHGFESFSLTFWQTLGDTNLQTLAKQVSDAIGDRDIRITTVSIFGNPLLDDESGETTREGWRQCIRHAHDFGCDLVTGFTGRLPDRPIDESLPAYKSVFSELVREAEDQGVRLAFENCDMGGTWQSGSWNIAHNPTAWQMMFDAVPSGSVGLEWEPCHQLVSLIDPIPQLRKWAPKIFHLHGKDATVAWDVVREYGVHGPHRFAWHRTPGFGDSNWSDIITILMQNGYKGALDIEGYHDPVHRGELELSGQLQGLKYLKACRGGDYVPSVF
jgi:sugar phosphate isomerase/epimerase